MPSNDKLYTVAGISTDANGVSKVRFTEDSVRRIKLFMKQDYTRVDLVDLPEPMLKLDALAYIANLPQFANDGDQMIIDEAVAYRKKAKAKADGTYVARPRGRPRKNPLDTVVKIKSPRNTKVMTKMSMDEIKARAAQIAAITVSNMMSE